MRSMRSLSMLAPFLLACPMLCGMAAKAQAIALPAVAPSVRIVNPIDENDLVTLRGNTHPLANAKTDRGRVRPDLPMTDLILVLSRSPERQAAFDKFVESQYTPGSPNFHKWLTPDQVGTEFGASATDIATISKWLIGHGFSISEASKDRLSIRFSGTAEQVESTFHTEIHNLEVRGVQHIGNMSDPQIPAALGPAVVGVKSLHNFFPRPLHRMGSKVTRDSATGRWMRPTNGTESNGARLSVPRPQYGISVPGTSTTNPYLVEDVAPYDFATIYNVLPLWNANTPIDGTGQTIAIAGTSSICIGQSDPNCQSTSGYNNDVATFRTTFGLPANQPTILSGNKQPLTVCPDAAGNCSSGDLVENTLDVEWSGAVAKGANIVLVASYPASSSDDGLYDSMSYIIQNSTANIMSVSYGGCELAQGTAGNVEFYNLWQSASTEGIAVFVASGDGGSAECDDGGDSIGTPYSAQYGLAVNGLASTPWNTAVGGTDFNWCALPTSSTSPECTASPYWNAKNNLTNGSSAVGYVPEVPWNNTCANSLTLGFLQAEAAIAGATAFTSEEGACNFVYNNSLTSNAISGLAGFVDTVGGAGGASGCVVSSTANNTTTCTAGSTSTGTANGSLTLANNGWTKPTWQANVTGIPADGVRDLPDVSFFAADGLFSSAYLVCVSYLDAASSSATTYAPCSYSATAKPTAQEVGGTSVASPAMAGVMALINQKAGEAQGSPNAELYTLASQQTYSNCSAEKVAAGNSCYFNDIDSGTNAVPCDYGAEEGDPTTAGIQSPNCSVTHTGDLVGILPSYSAGAGYDLATGLGSLNVANVVNAWPASTATETAKLTVTPSSTSVSASSALSVTVTVAAASSGGTTPTGKVTLLGGGYSSGAQALTAGAYTFSIPANSLGTGSDVLTVSYSGDTNYLEATGTTTVTVTTAASTGTATATVTVTPPSSSQSASSAISVQVTVGGSGAATPTGTVTLSSGSYTSSAEPLTAGAYTFSIPANSLTAGTDTLTVTYSGDSTYAAATGTASVTVTAATSTGTFTLSATTPSSVSPGTQSSSTITVTATGGYSGTASLTCTVTSSPSSAVDAPTCSLSPTSVTLSSTNTTPTVTATISTTAATTSQLARPGLKHKGSGWMGAGGGAVLALLVFLGIPARRRSWRSMAGAVLLMTALGAMTGCGDFWQAPSGNTSGGTTSGSYTFTVSGTGSPAVTPTPVTTTFILTVN